MQLELSTNNKLHTRRFSHPPSSSSSSLKLIIFPLKNKRSYITVIGGINQDLDSFRVFESRLGGSDLLDERGCGNEMCFSSVGKAHRNRRESRGGVHEGGTWPGYVYKFPFSTLPDPLCPAIRLPSVFDGRLMFKAGENVPIRNRTSADSSRPFLWMADTRSRLADGSCLSLSPTIQISNGFQRRDVVPGSTTCIIIPLSIPRYSNDMFLFQKFSKFLFILRLDTRVS